MVAILELPDIRRLVSPVSVREYHHLAEFNDETGRRTELIRGIVIDKMSKFPLHSRLLRRLFRLVQAAAELVGGVLVLKEEPLTFVDSEPEPDVSVIAGNEDDYALASHPATAVLVIEVAVTSVVLDREKAAIYAEANVPEYWIVLANEAAIEVHTAPVAGRYTQHRVYARGETIPSTALPTLRVELDPLFAG